MRVFSGSLATETNTFGPMPTGLASFKDRGYFPAGQHPDKMTFFSGPLWAARMRGTDKGWDLVEGMVAVRIAFDAGVGAHLMLRMGGKVSPMSGKPIDLDCTVKALKTAMVMTGLANTPVQMGDCALVEAQGIEIVLITLRNQAMGTDLFTQLGCDLTAKKIIVVKSSQHFYASFSKIARHVIYVAAPGTVTLDLTTLRYRKARRPKWPLDA